MRKLIILTVVLFIVSCSPMETIKKDYPIYSKKPKIELDKW